MIFVKKFKLEIKKFHPLKFYLIMPPTSKLIFLMKFGSRGLLIINIIMKNSSVYSTK